MTDNVKSLILEQLERIDQRTDPMEADRSDMRLHMTAPDDHMATLEISVSGIDHRPDRMPERAERRDRQLDLTEPK